MQMAGPDIVLFVVGALLFGGATYAIVSSDGDLGGAGSPVGAFRVTYRPAMVEVGQEALATMRSGSAEFTVNESNVLRVLVTVECADPASVTPAPFQVQVTASGPNGLTGDGSGACGSPITVEIQTGEALPGDTTAPGATEGEARTNLPDATNATANGAWSVTVSGSRGSAPALPVGDPSGSVTLAVEVAEPSFAPIQR